MIIRLGLLIAVTDGVQPTPYGLMWIRFSNSSNSLAKTQIGAKRCYVQLWVSLGTDKPCYPWKYHELTASRDLAESFPNGEYGEAFRSEWIGQLIKEVRSSPEYAARTKDTARWAREQIKRQPTGGQVSQMS